MQYVVFPSIQVSPKLKARGKSRQCRKGMEGPSVQNTYLGYWIWPIWTIYDLHLCQFIKFHLSYPYPHQILLNVRSIWTKANVILYDMRLGYRKQIPWYLFLGGELLIDWLRKAHRADQCALMPLREFKSWKLNYGHGGQNRAKRQVGPVHLSAGSTSQWIACLAC